MFGWGDQNTIQTTPAEDRYEHIVLSIQEELQDFLLSLQGLDRVQPVLVLSLNTRGHEVTTALFDDLGKFMHSLKLGCAE